MFAGGGDGGHRKGAGGGAHGKGGGRGKRKGGRRERQGRVSKGTNEHGGGSAAAAGGDVSSVKAGDGGTSEVRCHRCRKKGHWRIDCTEELCSRCHGRGHAADVCPTSKEEALLAVLDDDDDSDTVDASAFKADGMINYRECNSKLRIADGSTRTTEGYGDVNFSFRSGNGLVRVTLTNVAHVPDLRYHLFSLPTLVKHGHNFERRPAGIVVKLMSERSIVFPIVFPLTGNLYSLYGYRVDCSTRGDVCAVLAPGKLPNKPVDNINDYLCAAEHSHEALLRKTAEQQGVVLEAKLLECKGCSMAKSLRRIIKQPTHTLE